MELVRTMDRVRDFDCGCAARYVQRYDGREPDAWALWPCAEHTDFDLMRAIEPAEATS